MTKPAVAEKPIVVVQKPKKVTASKPQNVAEESRIPQEQSLGNEMALDDALGTGLP